MAVRGRNPSCVGGMCTEGLSKMNQADVIQGLFPFRMSDFLISSFKSFIL